MIDTYSLILWGKANNETKQEQIQKIYQILSILKEFGEPFVPNYLPAKKKVDCKSFILSVENIELLLKKTQKEEELDTKLGVGKSIDFFSSLNDDASSGIGIRLGNSSPRITNTVVIDFPTNFDFKQPDISNRLAELFKELVKIFNPYWGCISSRFNCQQFGGYYNKDKDIPNTVFWMNYWGEDITNALKVSKKVQKGKTDNLYEVKEYQDGYFLRLQEKLINLDNEKEVSFQKMVNSIFEL